MSKTQNLGRWGEELAVHYLKGKGYTILAQNTRTPFGEIDIIAQQTNLELDTIVFFEVKTRASTSLGKPEISVDARKRSHLLASVQHFMQNHLGPQVDWRVDVIAIERLHVDTPPMITHFENAITDV